MKTEAASTAVAAHAQYVHPADRTPGDILLEAGTNEFEVLVFNLCGNWFGINVAKVREVILPVKVTESPGQPPSVLGMFNIRGKVLPLVDLEGHLGLRNQRERNGQGRVIITEFNGQQTAFLVDTVDQIHRISWKRVKQAPQLDEHGECGSITGMIDLDGRLIQLLDFESITDEIRYQEKLHVDFVENTLEVDRAAMRVILAEDSTFVRRMIREIFEHSGYALFEAYSDGQEAWEAILRHQNQGNKIHGVVTDIEMPRMDGLALTRAIKSRPDMASVPVMLFSSLITPDNFKKGRQVGANAQVAKPDLPTMVGYVDRLVTGLPIDEPEIATSYHQRIGAA